MDKRLQSSPSLKKGDLRITKNYRGRTLTSIVAKVYNALLLNHIEPEIEKVMRKNQNAFQGNRSTASQIEKICQIIEGVHAKNLKATLLFVDFSNAFDSIHRGKMKQILLAYGLSKETVTSIMTPYKNTKAMVFSSDWETDFFDFFVEYTDCFSAVG